MYKPYAGIGSRETPADVLNVMQHLGYYLATMGFTLRSGGAIGADTAFEQGCDAGQGSKEIFLPWKGFEGNPSPFYDWPDSAVEAHAREIARAHHPAWERCTDGTKKMHTRNVQQIMGRDLSKHSLFVICWTKGGRGGGGTGQALRIATAHGIDIYDLGSPDAADVLQRLQSRVSGTRIL